METEPGARLFLLCTKLKIRHPGQHLRLPPGINRPSEGFHDRYPVEDYLDLFDQAAFQIQGNLTASAGGSPSQPNIIIGKLTSPPHIGGHLYQIPGPKTAFIKHTQFYKNKAKHTGKVSKPQSSMSWWGATHTKEEKQWWHPDHFHCTNISCSAQSPPSCYQCHVMSEDCCVIFFVTLVMYQRCDLPVDWQHSVHSSGCSQ